MSLPSSCRIEEVETGSKKELRWELVCDGERKGGIGLYKAKRCGRTLWLVQNLFLVESMRRRRIGTALYEHAAREACRRRAALGSDDRVSAMSRGFWRKQKEKGRAELLCVPKGARDLDSGAVYALSCPPPPSLAGLGKTRKAVRIEPRDHGTTCYEYDAYVDGVPHDVGYISVCRGKGPEGMDVHKVFTVSVDEEHRRSGVATKLYEAAAQEACRRGAPLASLQRDPWAFSNAFWQKQEKKGRVQVFGEPGSDRQTAYVLPCPAPASLAGRRRVDPDWGLPVDADGLVTLYHGTTKSAAQRIVKTKELRSSGEPDVYLTTDPGGGGYGDGGGGYGDGTVVAVKVRPERLVLDDEFPNGRQDFRIPLSRPGGSVRVQDAYVARRRRKKA